MTVDGTAPLKTAGREAQAALSALTDLVAAPRVLVDVSSEDQDRDRCAMAHLRDRQAQRVIKPSSTAEAIPKMATLRTTAILKNRMETESNLLLKNLKRNMHRSQKPMETGTDSESPSEKLLTL